MREEIKRLTGDPEERLALARVCDLAEKARERGQSVGDFLNPRLRELSSRLLASWPDLSLQWQGGYPGAERSRLVLFSPGETVPSFIEVLAVSGQKPLAHRDCLGALLGLGIRREKVGDLVLDGLVCQMVVAREIAGFIRENLHQVGRREVEVANVSPAVIQQDAYRRTLNTTVASLRLDAVIAAGFGVSRSQAASLVKGEKVRVNYRLETRSDREVHQDDVISVRGLGRLQLTRVGEKSRKDRFKVSIDRT